MAEDEVGGVAGVEAGGVAGGEVCIVAGGVAVGGVECTAGSAEGVAVCVVCEIACAVVSCVV